MAEPYADVALLCHLLLQVQHTPQVAAYPAFTDDNRPTGGGAVTVGPTEVPQQQLPSQQREGQQQRSWFTPWANEQQQQQQQQPQQLQEQLWSREQLQQGWQQVQQQQQQSHADASAAMQMKQDQQQDRAPQPQSSGDAFISQLQQCAGLGDVTALMRCQQQEQQLTLPQASAMLQRLCSVTRVSTLTALQQQQLQECCNTAADTALRELSQLGHTEMGQTLAMFQVLGYKPEGAWVRSILQHAGTELVHYNPAELSLLLLTATQASARCGAIPGPDITVMQLLSSKRVPQPNNILDVIAAASANRQQPPQQSQQQQQQAQQQRRANTVLTSAWLQHFLATFQPYIACRSAHPQLSPGHMEAVISCLAALRVAPDRFWMYLFVRQMSAQLPSCSPGSVVRMLGGLATLGYRLPDHVLLQVERQIGTAAAMVQLRAEDCVEVVRSVAVLRAQQTKPSDAWLQELLAAAVRGSRHLNASAVIGLLAATAALGLQLEPSWMDVLLLQARAVLSAMTPHEHVSLIDALSQQQHQYRPGPVFMSVYLAQVANHLPELTVSQQAALATGLATVGYKPGSAWMAAYMAQLLSQPVTGADGEDLLQVLRALRRMQYVPAPAMAQRLSGLIDSIQLSVPYNQLLLLREALDELQYQRGIMAVPGGPRRAAEAAAAAAAAAAASGSGPAASECGLAGTAMGGDGKVEAAAAADVVAVDGVVDSAALQAAQVHAAHQAELQQAAAQQAAAHAVVQPEVQPAQTTISPNGTTGSADGPGNEVAVSAAADAPVNGTSSNGAAIPAVVDAAPGAVPDSHPAGQDQAGEGPAQAGVAATEGAVVDGAATKCSAVGAAQESLELFA